MSTTQLIVLIVLGSIIGFVIAFALIWCLVVLIISAATGWGRLARTHTARVTPEGTAFTGETILLGSGRYRRCVTIHVSAGGLYLTVSPFFKLGHPPLYLPWDFVRSVKFLTISGKEAALLILGDRAPVNLTLRRAIYESARELSDYVPAPVE